MSVNAYVRTQKVAASPRSTEFRLMSEVTGEMIAARDAGLAGIALTPVLHRNRVIWGTFSTLCLDSANALPDALRAGIISLALWVDRQTSVVIGGHDTIDALIDVNRTVMVGLANENGPVGGAQPAAATE